MSKKYKGKPCAYCVDASSTTADHVFAREFFLPEARHDLAQVPACSSCNGEKSVLEHYFTAVLPFGARHAASAVNLKQMVPKRLGKNAKLHRTLRNNWGKRWAEERGIQVPVSTLPVDPAKVERLFDFIVRGLVLFHWGAYLTRDYRVQVLALTRAGEEYIDGLFRLNAAARVRVDLGNGTFSYEGAQGVDCPQITVWRFQTYGGLKFADSEVPGEVSSGIGALTGPVSNGPNMHF